MTKSEYKQIRLNPDVRELLDEYKMNGESYSIAIGRLFRENAILRDSQERLMKIAMQTEDAIALPTINHKTYFALMELLQMNDSDDDKLENMKIYLSESLHENPSQVYENVISFYIMAIDNIFSWEHDWRIFLPEYSREILKTSNR